MNKKELKKKVKLFLALSQMSKEGVKNEEMLKLVSNNFSPEVVKNLVGSIEFDNELEVNLGVIQPLIKVEENGLLIDFQKLKEEVYEDKNEYLENLKTQADFSNYPGNPGSESWCKEVLKTICGEVTKLENLSEDMCEDNPIFGEVKKARAMRKELDMFDNIKAKSENGKVHTVFLPYSGLSGRMVSYNPPIQNLPSVFKEYLISSNEDEELYELDIKNAEILALAWLTSNEEIYKIIAQGKDIYVYVASQVLNCNESEVSPLQRKVMKKIVNGITYGMGSERISQLLNKYQIFTVKVDKNVGEQVKEVFFELFPKLKEYQGEQTRTTQLETALGHKFNVKPSYKNISFGPQNLIALLMKKSLISLYEKGEINHVINIVHDSVWVQSDEETVVEIKKTLEENLLELTKGTECEGMELIKISKLGGSNNVTTN